VKRGTFLLAFSFVRTLFIIFGSANRFLTQHSATCPQKGKGFGVIIRQPSRQTLEGEPRKGFTGKKTLKNINT
jgi:hypothetical protein